MRMNNKLYIYILFLLSFTISFAANYQIKVIKSQADEIELKIQFDKPQIIHGKNGNYAYYKKGALVVNENYKLVPLITKFISIAGKNPFVSIVATEKERINQKQYLKIISDTVKIVNTQKIAVIKYSGLYKNIPLYALQLYPVSVNPDNNSFTYIKKLHIKISSKTSSKALVKTRKMKSDRFTKDLFINGDEIYAQTPIVNKNIQSLTESSTSLENRDILMKTDVFKIGVAENGIYKITYEDLDKAGFPLANLNPHKLQMFNKGGEIPIYINGIEDGSFDEGDYIDFWGVKNEKTFIDKYPDLYNDPFSDINIYWLIAGDNNGRRLVNESGGIYNTGNNVIVPNEYREKLHFEKDNTFVRFGDESAGLDKPSYEMDHWFYDQGVSSVSSKVYECYLPYPSKKSFNNVYVKAVFRGKSVAKQPYNNLIGHQVSLWLNTEKVGEVMPYEKWKNQTRHVITNEGGIGLPQGNLKNGVNELRVNMEQENVTDIVLLNWFDISYMRKYKAYKDFIKFKLQHGLPDNYTIQYEVDGFTSKDITVYKLGVSKIINGKVDYYTDTEDRESSYRITIQDEVIDPDIEYVAVTEKAKKKPVFITRMKPWKEDDPSKLITDTDNSANYLIITNDYLYDEALRLKELKEKIGLKSEAVKVSNIYDAFNYGIKSPLAIKDFLRYALNSWNQSYPLEYVVFVGDASYNYKDKYDLVPTMMFETHKYGASASDYLYSLLSGDDDIPDVVVGRIPVSTNEQLSNYIDKVQKYQFSPEIGEWVNTALFISGNDAVTIEALSNDHVFRAQNLRLLNMKLPSPVFGHRLNSVKNGEEYDPDFGGTTDLIEYFDNGVSYINFLGHGGGGIWADVSLMNLSDVARLNNGGRLPFISSMTCYTGAFENPGRDGLAERLVLAENKGAIAMLASSGVGWVYNDFAVEWGLLDYLWEEGITMGQAVNLMKIYYLNNPLYYYDDGSFSTFDYNVLKESMVNQYNFIGDPAIEIKKVRKALQVSIDNQTPAAGDSINITVTGGITSGSGRMEITDNEAHRLLEKVFNYSGEAHVPFVVPNSVHGHSLAGNSIYVKVYAGNDIEDADGYAEIGVEKSIVKHIETVPQTPYVNEGISFKVALESHFLVRDMTLKNFYYIDENNHVYSYRVSINMEQVSDTLFQSINEFPGFTTAGLKFYDIVVHDANGKEYIYRWRKLNIKDDRPDLQIIRGSEQYTGIENVQFQFKVKNDADVNMDSVRVVCYQITPADSVIFSDAFYTFESGEVKTIRVYFSNNVFAPQRGFKIVVDPQNLIEERDEKNNIHETVLQTTHFFISKNIGTTLDGVTNDTLTINNIWKFYVAPKTITASTVMAIQKSDLSEYIERSDQKDLKFISVIGQNDTTGIKIDIINQNSNFIAPAFLSCRLDTSVYDIGYLKDVSSFMYDRQMGMWVKQGSSNGINLYTSVTKSGLIGVYHFKDQKNPVIEITTNGRPLSNDMLIPDKPSIAILLQDENGINFKNSFDFKIDGEPLSDDDIAVPDTLSNPNYISILANPVLSSGSHTLQASIADVNGNVTTKTINFAVSNEFQIQVYGNYPNPFQDETIISYNIIANNTIDDINIKIYNIAGRLVRSNPLTLDETIGTDHDIKTVGYHELIWDGTDDNNVPVANGVYFLIFRGKYSDKIVKTTLKVAKLR